MNKQTKNRTARKTKSMNSILIGFATTLFILIVVAGINYLNTQRTQNEQERAETDFTTIAGLMEGGKKEQVIEKIKELKRQYATSQSHTEKILTLNQKLELVNHVIDKFDLTDDEKDWSAQEYVQSTALKFALSGVAGVDLSEEREDALENVKTLKKHPTEKVRREACFALVMITMSKLVAADSDSEEVLQANRKEFGNRLNELFQEFPHDAWVADTLQQLSPIVLNANIDKDARVDFLQKTVDHFSTSKYLLQQKLAKAKNDQRLLVKYDIDQVARDSTYLNKVELRDRLALALDDPKLSPTFLISLTSIPRKLIRASQYDKARMTFNLFLEQCLKHSSESGEWSQCRKVMNNQLGLLELLGKDFRLEGAQYRELQKSFLAPICLVIFVDDRIAGFSGLEAEFKRLVEVGQYGLAIVVVHPPSQTENLSRVREIGEVLNLTMWVEESPPDKAVREAFFLGNENHLLLLKQGKLVEYDIPTKRMAISCFAGD